MQAATERFRRMVLGVTGGPRPSGDEAILEKHTWGTLKTCKQSVALLNLKTNAAVRECCGRLDDQEGRAFLAADQMGVELVRDESDVGNSRGNEARKLGEEIDEVLKEYETKYEKLGVNARKARQRARDADPDGADEKVAAIEAKLVADRAALGSTEVSFKRLPDTRAPIKVKRERPRAPRARRRCRDCSSSPPLSRRRRKRPMRRTQQWRLLTTRSQLPRVRLTGPMRAWGGWRCGLRRSGRFTSTPATRGTRRGAPKGWLSSRGGRRQRRMRT